MTACEQSEDRPIDQVPFGGKFPFFLVQPSFGSNVHWGNASQVFPKRTITHCWQGGAVAPQLQGPVSEPAHLWRGMISRLVLKLGVEGEG